jgi:hypothetical protein
LHPYDKNSSSTQVDLNAQNSLWEQFQAAKNLAIRFPTDRNVAASDAAYAAFERSFSEVVA